MKRRPRFCVVGAGAVGGTIAAHLIDAGHDVTVIARGARRDHLRAHGLKLRYPARSIEVVPTFGELATAGVQDVIVLSVKTTSLPKALSDIAPLIGGETIVIPTINGMPWWYFQGEGGPFDGDPVTSVDPAGALKASVPHTQILGCVVYLMSEVELNGALSALGPPRLLIGELNHRLSARAHALVETLTEAGIETGATDRVRDHVWVKVALNLATNPLSVVTEASLYEMLDQPDLLEIVTSILRETAAVAAAYHADRAIDLPSMIESGKRAGRYPTSMLQDFRLSRPLELPAIGDAMLEMAAKVGLQMPVSKTILDLVRYRVASRLE